MLDVLSALVFTPVSYAAPAREISILIGVLLRASLGNTATSTVVGSPIIANNPTTDVDLIGSGANSFVSEGYNVIGNGNATPAGRGLRISGEGRNRTLGPLLSVD